jgi:predicted small metal-binding protein
MAIELRCECGFLAAGTDEAAFVLAAQEHARVVHELEVPAATLLARATSALSPGAASGDKTSLPAE